MATCGWLGENGMQCGLEAFHDDAHEFTVLIDEFDEFENVTPLDFDILSVSDLTGPPKNAEASLSPIEPVEPVAPADPIAALEAQLQALMANMEALSKNADSYSDAATMVEQAKAKYLVEVTQKISKFDADIDKALRERRKVEKELADAEAQKDRILADISHERDAQTALEMLETARARWAEIKKQHNWMWVEKAFNYQNVAIEFMASVADRDLFGVALLDEMGLGKTVTAQGAIDLLQHHPLFEDRLAERLDTWKPGAGFTGAVLYIAPDSIKDDIQRELNLWTDRPSVVLEGNPERRKHLVDMAHQFGMTLIVGYAQLRDRKELPVTPELFNHEWPIIIADEVQEARNEMSSTFINLRKLVQKGGFFFPMSGTPIENRAVEFWVILHLLTQKGKRQDEFYSSARFEQMYLYSWDQTFQHGGFEKLMNSVSDMVLRRTKQDVGKDLPDKIRTVHFVTMSGKQRELYEQMRQRMYVWLDEQHTGIISSSSMLALLTRLRQIALLPSSVKIDMGDGKPPLVLDCDESVKVDRAMTLIRQAVGQNQKIVIASNFNHVLHHIQKLIAEEELTWQDSSGKVRPVLSGALTGKTKPADRTSYIERFNTVEDDVRVLVGNIKAMGLGLNLQKACSTMVFLDLYWNPKRNEQTEDRLHRTGQQYPVNIHIIHADDSVDNLIAKIIEEKLGVFDGMFDQASLRKALDDGLI